MDNRELKIAALGGMQEIGKNMYVYEYGDDIIVVDVGVKFPTEDQLGIDLVIPDTTYLQQNREKIRGFIVTHGHEDHIGALPFVLKDFPEVPIYGSNITTALIMAKLKNNNMKHSNIHNVRSQQVIELGEFKVRFFTVCHSIAGAYGLGITTPVGTVVHTGDFKIDHTPIDSERTDLVELARMGREGVLCLLADSTNAEREGYTASEKIVGMSFDKYFKDWKSRIFIATFSSNIHRLQQIVDTAQKYGRKICFAGRSMVNVKEVSIELGYLKLPEGMEVNIDKVDKLPDDQIVIVTTGSQGENMSGLVRMATNEHKSLDIRKGDMVIVSATPIPGNEKYVSRVVDQLYRKGAIVVGDDLADVHVSGHAKQEELKLIQSLVQPKYFIPMHGEYRMLIKHALLGEEMGVKPENIFILDNGERIEFCKNGTAKRIDNIHTGEIMIDGSGIGDVGNIVLRDRRFLSQDGIFIVVVGIDKKKGIITSGPDVISRGFIYVRESEEMINEAKLVVTKALNAKMEQGMGEWSDLKNAVRNSLRDYLYKETKRNPMILPIIVE